MPSYARRTSILIAALFMFLCLGTGHAWSAYTLALQKEHGYSVPQTQVIYTTLNVVFCFGLIVAGRLHDRFGPRILSVASGILLAGCYFIAWRYGAHYGSLWLGVGVLFGLASATGYVCPIATAIKWFPNHRGLVAGLAAAAFGASPVLLSNVLIKPLLSGGWHVLDIYGLLLCVYPPVVVLSGLLMVVPPTAPHAVKVKADLGGVLRDRRFWTLWVGMLCGTMPFLLVMGNVEALGTNFGIGQAVFWAISCIAVSNAFGRVFWGALMDRIGPHKCMAAAQVIMILAMGGLMLLGHGPWGFLVAASLTGFCYGSCFAIYPATVARVYGVAVLGSIYPLVMAAQGVSAFAPSLNGWFYRASGSYYPGLGLGLGVALAGLIVCSILARGDKARL